jgi:uncharacterized lipoprotein YehR (DUF1307 family)
MKKTLSLLTLMILAVSLLACTPAKESKTYLRVKCPSCGYEFEAPQK